MFKKALRAAFPCTTPVMAGYLFVGFTFGLLMRHGGNSPIITLLMSVFVYAGSMQFVAINFLTGGHGLIEIALMTLLINARHMFYGISFIEKFRHAGRKKPYMIFSLTDETFSLLCSASIPVGVESTMFYFCVALLDQFYWVVGTVAGSLAGAALAGVNIKGIDFAMTALFVSIFVDQWKSSNAHAPALIGAIVSAAALLILGPSNFILPAMLAIIVLLFAFKKPIEKKYAVGQGEAEEGICQTPDMRS